VECKEHSSQLTQRKVSEIYANYLPLYRDNLVDEILIVTSVGIAPSAEAMCQETRELKHLTFHDLEAVIIDFEPYLRGLIVDYEEDGLNAYYVPPVTQNGDDLGQSILDWLATDEPRPIAVLGSYGMGKTTLARHLAWNLAAQALKSRTMRIPILVPLGEISSEQSLSGLLGKLFTSRSLVRNYNFELFMRLRKGTSLLADEIPKELILAYCDSPKEFEARRRDLVLACFLSRKMGEALYFPHRSFQEFLVAEKIIELLASEASNYDLVASIVTEEVSFFINDMVGLDTLEGWDPAYAVFAEQCLGF
jgi:hypothetical protein